MRSDCRTSLAGALGKEPFFAALSMRRRREVLLHTSERMLQACEFVFDEDSKAEGLYILASGAVRLARRAFGRTMIIGGERALAILATSGCSMVAAIPCLALRLAGLKSMSLSGASSTGSAGRTSRRRCDY